MSARCWPAVRVPALAIYRDGDRTVPVADGRYLAEHIPHAVYAELPGKDHTLFVGDQRATVDAVIGFIDRQVAGGALRVALAFPRPRVRSVRHTRLEYHADPGTGGNQHPIPPAPR